MALSNRGGPELRDYLRVFQRRQWLIVFCTVLVVGTALVLSALQTPVYEARARLLIDRDRSVFGGQTWFSDPNFVETQMQVITSEPIRELVRSTLKSAPPVSATAVGTTSVVQISAQSEDPRQAATIANAYADAYVAYRRTKAADALAAASRELQAKIEGLQRQIDDLGRQLAEIPPCTTTREPSANCGLRDSVQQDRDGLVAQQVPFRQKLDQMQVDSSVGDTGTQVVVPATVPTRPVRPTPVRNGLLALGVGLVFGIALAFLSEQLDDSIKGFEDFEKAVPSLPVLAMIPSVSSSKDRDRPDVVARSHPNSSAAEAYRTLRTSIRFLAVDRPLRTLQITSASAGEGKTTTSANLGVALARAGERVVIVSCDLRRPRLHSFFGLSNDVGFTSVLLGESPLASALQRVEGDERLWLLASGPLPPNPSELLSSARAGDLLTSLTDYADTVIVDCPPVLPVTDSVVLSSRVDGTLLVVGAHASTGKQVTRAVETLRQVEAPLFGAVLNNVSGDNVYGYNYGYYGEAAVGTGALPVALGAGRSNGQKTRAGDGSARLSGEH